MQAAWPSHTTWHETDLLCPECQGLLKPAVRAYEEPIAVEAWENAIAAINNASVLLILGSRLAVSSVAESLQLGRKQGAQFIFINDMIPSTPMLPEDIFLFGKLEQIFPVLRLYLD